MGAVLGQEWELGREQVYRDLERLQGWDRESLKRIYAHYRSTGSVVVNLDTFWRHLRFQDRVSGELAFDLFGPREGRVDLLTVLGPMVVMSDQHFLSKASLLFSMYDLNSSGAMNRAECGIAVRTLFRGIACFFKSVPLPTQDEIEQIVSSILDRPDDEERSDMLTFGEFMAFAYRSRAYRGLTAPFLAADTRVYEQQVFFAGRGIPLDPRGGHATVKQLERKLRHRLRLTPDPIEEGGAARMSAVGDGAPVANSSSAMRWRRPKGRGRRRPFKQSAIINRFHAWAVWRLYRSLALSQRTVTVEELLRTLSDDLVAAKALSDAVEAGLKEHFLAKEEWSDALDGGIPRIMQHLCLQLAGGHVKQRLEGLREAGSVDVSLRGLLCIVWPHAREADIETCFCWCRAHQAQRVVQELLRSLRDEDPDLDAEDLEELFDVLEGNGDGQLGMAELCKLPGIDIFSVQKLARRLDTEHTGSLLSKVEARSVLFHADLALREQFKLAFAAAKSQQMHTPREAA